MDGPQETVGGKSAMNALDALRYDWGSAYEIESADGEWRASRLDSLGDWIEAESPDDLRNQIFSDYALKPVRMRGCEAQNLQQGSGSEMPDKPVKDQVVRHMIFSAAHPEVVFASQLSMGWEATYPDGENGTQTVRRLELSELLDELEERF